MYPMATIKITGFGLIVNGPVAIIHDALTKAGYEVEMPEYDGQYQYWDTIDRENWPKKEVDLVMAREGEARGGKVSIEVKPLPWPG